MFEYSSSVRRKSVLAKLADSCCCLSSCFVFLAHLLTWKRLLGLFLVWGVLSLIESLSQGRQRNQQALKSAMQELAAGTRLPICWKALAPLRRSTSSPYFSGFGLRWLRHSVVAHQLVIYDFIESSRGQTRIDHPLAALVFTLFLALSALRRTLRQQCAWLSAKRGRHLTFVLPHQPLPNSAAIS